MDSSDTEPILILPDPESQFMVKVDVFFSPAACPQRNRTTTWQPRAPGCKAGIGGVAALV